MINLVKKVLTENPYKEIWKQLSFFKDDRRTNELIRARLNLKNKEHLNNTKKQAEQIKFSIQQAEGYFNVAQHSSLEVKPNLLYYGIISLGTALFLFKLNGNYSLDVLRKKKQGKHHGLNLKTEFKSLPTDENKLINILSKIKIEITKQKNKKAKGTFKYFYKALDSECISVHQIIYERGKAVFRERDIPIHNFDKPRISTLLEKNFSLDMLFSYLPDLVNILNDLNIQSRLFFGNIESKLNINQENKEKKKTPVAIREIFINGVTKEQKIYFKNLYSQNKQIKLEYEFPNNLHFGLALENSKEKKAGYFPDTIQDTFGQIYFIYKPENYILEPANYYISMYALSMLCRYYPDTWVKWLEKNESFRVVVDSFCSSALRKFPNLILNQLNSVIYNFRTQ